MGEADAEVRSSRKRKEKIETDNSDVCPVKKVKNFCCQTFRQKLKGNEVLKSLKEFIAASKVSDEVVNDYLESGGSLKEILSIIDVTAAEDLTTAVPVFETVHLILLRCLSADSKHHMKCVESGRNILRSHILTIKAMLSMDVSKHKKVALKVLTAIATLDTSFANEIMNLLALSPTLITDFIQPSPEKDSVRKCFIMFVLSFLIEGNVTVIKNLLDKKGFLGSIIPGLRFDDATTVNVTLSVFEEKILKNVNIQKTYKLKLFNTQIIKSLFDLYEWKGPGSIKQILVKKKHKVKEVEISQNEKDIVIESVHSFLLLLCCSSKYGVAFQDKSFGMSDSLNNQLLLTVFESISDPLKTKKTAEVLLKTIISCPDLMKPLLFKLEPFFQPRNSKNWLQAMDFAENLLKSLDVPTMLKAGKEFLTASDLVKIGKNLCAPVTFLRVVKSVFQKPETLEIQFRCLSLLTIIWRETQNLIAAFERFRSEVKRPLYRHLLKSLPEGEDLIELWHTLCDVEFFGSLALTEEKKIDFLSAVLKSFHIVLECQRGPPSSSLGLVSDLLQHVEVIKESLSNGQFAHIQEQVVKLMETDVQYLTPTLELFEKSLRILLQSTDDSCLSYLSRILLGLEVFSRNQAEVDVWLCSYWTTAREHRAKFADLLIVSLMHANGNKVCTEESEIFTGVSDSHLLSTSPLIFNCIEIAKLRSSRSSKKNEKYVYFAQYLNNVAVHLQFFYGVDIYLHDQLKQFGQVLSESTLSFLKGWKETCWTLPGPEVPLCPSEFALASCIVNGEHDSQTVKGIIDSAGANLLKLYSLFKMVVAYLTKKSVDGELSESDVEKFCRVLSLFLCDVAEDDRGVTHCISFSPTDRGVYQRACLECLFRSKHLLERFNVFQRKRNADHSATALVLKILMRKGLVKSPAIKKTLTEPWKMKFVKQLKSKLKKTKFLDFSSELEVVLEFFDFDLSDANEVLNLFVDVSDVGLFVNGDSLSAWTMILTSFVKFHCEEKELNGASVKKLCLIMSHLCENYPSAPVQMVDCFVNLLRKHPKHLLLINNEFLDVILLKGNFSSAACTLGKLLLNDPQKVDYFLELVEKNLKTLKEPRTALCLLSNLIANEEDSSRDAIFLQQKRSVWKITEIGAESDGKVYEVLKAVYRHFEPDIIRLLLGEKGKEEEEEGFFLENIDFTRHLIWLFLDEEKVNLVKGDIAKGTFEPTLVYEAVRKVSDIEMSENYLRGLLVAFCRVVRDQERGIGWKKYCDIVSDLVRFGEDFPRQRVVEMVEWKDFARLAVGHSLNSVKDSWLLKIFRLLVTALYDANEESKDCALFFQMFIAHSQFLKVLLSESVLKSEAVELFFRLVERAPSQMSPKHFPVLLASYGAGMSSRDATVLEILRLYETSGVAVGAYEPFVWGETAVSHYSIGASPGLSLWQRFNMKNVLDLIDGHRLELSLREFPIRRSLKGGLGDSAVCDADIYDPAFLLPLFSSLMSPGAVVYSLAFIYKGGLAYTVRALSSECKDIRLMASVVLTRFYNHLELSQNLKQKLVWMHFINRLRYGMDDLSRRVLPNVTTLFLARMTLELSRHPAEMYSPLQNYLLAKPYFLFDTVPEFLPLFHSAEISSWRHREWLLEVLRDGTKTSVDVSAVFHSMALKVIFCFFYSEICDSETKKLILQVLERMMRVGKSVLLLSEYGLLSWISAMDFASCQPILHNLLELLSTLTRVIVKEIKLHRNKHSNMSHLIQILNVALRLLESLKSVKSVEAFRTYLKIFHECLILFFKQKQNEWFKLNKSCLFDIMRIGTEILGEELDCRKLVEVPFYFRSFDKECGGYEGCEKYEVGMDLKDCVHLFRLLTNGEENEE